MILFSTKFPFHITAMDCDKKSQSDTEYLLGRRFFLTTTLGSGVTVRIGAFSSFVSLMTKVINVGG